MDFLKIPMTTPLRQKIGLFMWPIEVQPWVEILNQDKLLLNLLENFMSKHLLSNQ
ncbi:MAG: hypothetical protein Ct9H90mP20_7040 [Candidatus Neomarinimicrobiota bacterium]|nr:MAG: hypothetical protein Ct9H90mP20_7040 [Candidatus Neomarinimicrobiota bacterium]